MSTIRYQLTEEEVVRGLIKSRPRRRRIFLGVLLVFLGVLELYLRSQTRSANGESYAVAGYVFIGFGVISTLLMPLLYQRVYSKLVRANPSLTAAKEVSFDDKGLASSSSVQKLEVSWTYFKKLTQDEKYFYLHVDGLGNVSLLPKSAFDEAGRQEFLKCSQSVLRA